MESVTDRLSNPFGMTYPCERPVPGYGDADAHLQAVGDHPGVHGGADAGIPLTDCPAADRLVATLRELRRTEYRREADLGRFVAGAGPYFVR